MAINFPNSPSVNDTFTVGGTTFTFTGVKWESSAVVNLSSDTTPTLGGQLDGAFHNIHGVGVITATAFHGDGSNLTGIQGLAVPLGVTDPLIKFLKTPKIINIGAGTSLTIQSDITSGNIAFVKEATIHVAAGATFHVKNNTKLRLNVLGIFS